MPAKTSKITVMVWNIWFKTQLDKPKLKKLNQELTKHVKKYSPDIIGLHEVLTDAVSGESPVFRQLNKLGYMVESVPFSPSRANWLTGNAIAYKQKSVHSGKHILGPDTPAFWRGHGGHKVSLMYANVKIGDNTLHFVLNYLAHLVPYNWITHFIHVRNFQKFISQKKFNKQTIVVGDFNEFKWMLPLWHKRFDRRTGNRRNPTWQLHGKWHWPLQANYDNVCWSKDGSLELAHFAVLDKTPSDHAPLVATFRVS